MVGIGMGRQGRGCEDGEAGKEERQKGADSETHREGDLHRGVRLLAREIARQAQIRYSNVAVFI